MPYAGVPKTERKVNRSLYFNFDMIAEGTYKGEKVANPPKLHRVYSDDILLAKRYIGPIHRIQ